MKKQSYFSHDYYANSDPKLSAFDNEFGLSGYGLYWKIIERLHIEENHCLELKEYLFRSLAKHNSTSVEQIKIMLDFAINECELFEVQDGFLYSKRVNRNIETMESIKEKRSYAGKISANNKKKATDVEQVLTSVKQNSTNVNTTQQNKIKENKRKNKNTDSNELYSAFIEIYKSEFGLEYEKTAEKKDISGITKIANLYIEKNPDSNTEQAKSDIINFFKNCCKVTDDYLLKNLNPMFIANNINKYKLEIQKPKVKHETTKSVFNSRLNLTADDLEHSRDKFLRQYGVREVADAN